MAAHQPISYNLRVFLCHSSGDKPTVRPLYRRLKRAGFQPWLDEENLIPGQRWDEEIKKTVRQCDVIVVCLSRNSITKEGYVQKEIKIALDIEEEKPEGSIFIVPVLLEEVQVPERLREWQYAQLYHKDGYKKLIRALKIRADQISARRGDAFAMYRLGLDHLRHETEHGYREALCWFEQGAQAGHAGALNQIGVLYLRGLGVAQNFQSAHEYFEKAAEAGDIYAMYNLGSIYADGLGVSQDYAHARRWFEKAANAGHVGAMNRIGILYNNALGVQQDYDEARKWQAKAASAGDSAAMYNLGITYEKGRGVPQDLAKARQWFEQAAKAGNKNAKKKLSEMKAPPSPKPEVTSDSENLPSPKMRVSTAGQETNYSSSPYQGQGPIYLQLAMFEAERMRDQFQFNNPKLNKLLHHAIVVSYQQETQSTTKIEDPAMIPVVVQLDEHNIDAILRRYKNLSGPTDENTYRTVSKTKAWHEEFEQIRAAILQSRITNRLFTLLHSLREFFLRHPELLNRKSNKTFFAKWLQHPMVEMNMQSAAPMWTAERVVELHSDLGLIQC